MSLRVYFGQEKKRIESELEALKRVQQVEVMLEAIFWQFAESYV